MNAQPNDPRSADALRNPAPHDAEDNAVTENPTARRNFLSGALAFLTGGLILIVPAAGGLAFFLDPLSRRNRKLAGGKEEDERRDPEGFLRVTAVASLPADGRPQNFVVYDDVVDAWNKFLDQPIGRVFLRKLPDGKVTAFNVRCPHLGCAVDFRPDRDDYFCPCHSSTFDLNGKRLNEIPPRGMDALEVKIKGSEIWVKFQTFKAGTPEKIPVNA
jgi:menaquinol-cytochrome c reductase iron-sulfur subunit